MHNNKKSLQEKFGHNLNYYRHVGSKPLLHTVVLGARGYLSCSLNPVSLQILDYYILDCELMARINEFCFNCVA